jgi:hypothetical protein
LPADRKADLPELWCLKVAQNVSVTAVLEPPEVLAMTHLATTETISRVNRAVLLSLVWGGFAICAVGAAVYDIANWLDVL